MMKYNYHDVTYPVKVIRKKNKNTYIRFKDNILYITTNYLVTDISLRYLLKTNSKSINNIISKSLNKDNTMNSFSFFGSNYQLIFDKTSEVTFRDNFIYVKDEDTWNNYLDNYLKDIFQKHLDYWVSCYQEEIPIPNLKIRKMTSRWGVCNTKNHNITLNYYLYKFDIKCLDYVIVHELSHFIVPNHSKDFWMQVAKYCPCYKEIRKLMR